MSETALFSHSSDSPEQVLSPEAEASIALQNATSNLHELADALDDQQPLPSDAFDEIYGEELDDILREGAYSADDAEELVIAIDRLAQDHNCSIWPVLLVVPNRHLQEVATNNPDLTDDLLESVWSLHTETTDEYEEKIVLSNALLSRAYGPAHTWRKAGEVRDDLPSYMHEAVADPDFTLAAVKTVEVNMPGEEPHMQIARVRAAQKHILRNCMGLPAEIASIYDRSLDKRTLNRDKNGMLIPASVMDGGINDFAWHTALQTAAETTKYLSQADIKLLYDDLGIVNYDRFSGKQLQTMVKLLQADSETVAYFKSHDSAMQFGDVDGDDNNAMVGDPAMFDGRMPTIVAEIHNIVDLYRPLITIHRRTGIQPAILAFSLHGSPGAMGVRERANEFEIISWPVEAGVKPQAHKQYEQYSVQTAKGLADFLSFYMQPHSQTGERTLLFLSCSQATGYKGLPPLPELVVSRTAVADNVVARAPRMPVSIVEYDGGYRFFDRVTDAVVPSIDFRLSAKSVASAAKVVKKSNKGSLL
jgi:hypothetical protein